MTVRKRGWIWFLAWTGVGAVGVTALLTPLTIGPYLAVVVLAGVVALGRIKRSHPGLPGLVAGAGVLPLVIAWLNRSGPGNVCIPGSCTEEWSPWPWLAAGTLLLVLGAVLFARRTR